MALTNQIHIYSVDTEAFYTKNEKRLHNARNRYLRHKKQLLSLDTSMYDAHKLKKYKRLVSFVNKKIHDLKDKLKDTFKLNNDIRYLDKTFLNDKNIISVFESNLTRISDIKINELSMDLIVVQTFYYDVIEQIIKNGFMLDDEKYIFYTSSAGQIRTKKTVFIKESLWKKNEKTLMCGLTINKINEQGGINVNKFLAYLALQNSATDLWNDFDIDRCIVVDDFETNVFGLVDFMNDETYEIKRCEMEVPVTHTDGCGMILPKLSKKNFMVRLPWVKGLLASFDYVKFIKKYNCSPTVTDIYGKEWDIIQDDIQIIFTKSQFKMYKYYMDWDEYKKYFKQYHCMVGKCNVEEDYFSNATINYQMVQSLTDMNDDELNDILKPSINRLNNITSNKDTMLNIFGATNNFNKDKSNYQKALLIYPELLTDEYSKHTLREIKNSMIKSYRSCKLEINGKYTFLVPDLFAVCEYLFLGIQNPNGLLKDGEVFCKLFKENKLDCLRSPHLYREHAIRNNVVDKEKSEWFKTNAIYTSCFDLISKILQFDVDGDKSLVVADQTFVNVAERNIKNDMIVPLYYNMRKAKPVILNSNTVYNGLNSAYTGGNIGIYSNNISKIWNSGNVGEKELKVIKLLVMENNFVIDMAKTLYMPTRPNNIDELIKLYTKRKLPHFFIYAKDKTENQVEHIGSGVVDLLEDKIKNIRLKFDFSSFGKLNYKYMMHNNSASIDYDVVDIYNALNKSYHIMIENTKDKDNVSYVISKIRKELVSYGYSEQELTDILVKYLYTEKRTSRHKKLLWECFGDIIYNNLLNNIPKGSVMCNKCGKRFIPNNNKQIYCEDCAKLIKKENDRKRIAQKRKMSQIENG